MVESDLSDDNNDPRSTTPVPATGKNTAQRVLIPVQNRITPLGSINSNASISATVTRTTRSERKSLSSDLFNSSNDDEDDGVIDLCGSVCGSDTDSCLKEPGKDVKQNGDILASEEKRSREQTPSTMIDNDSFHRDPPRGERTGGRNRIKTNRYCDEFAGITVEDKELDFDDKKDTGSVALNSDLSDEDEAEEEWDSATHTNDACWKRESALYDSNREESSSEDEELSDDDSEDSSTDAFDQRSQHKAGRKRRRTPAARQKSGRKPIPLKNNVEVLRRLSSLEIQAELEKIQNFDRDDDADDEEDEEDEGGVKMVYLFLVCIMWDFDFRYTLMQHQYKGVLMVAGIDTKALCRQFSLYSNEEKIKLVNLEGDGRTFRRKICTTARFVATKGMLLGDDMGLGKTIQGIGGAILRNRILALHSESNEKVKKAMPTIIVGPNDAVLEQWEDTLLLSGVPVEKIKRYWKKDETLHFGEYFVLLTRYQVMSAMKELMHSNESNLFPKVKDTLLKKLQNQYEAGKGTARNKWKRKKETVSQCITRLLREACRQSKWKITFRTLLIDESHFLRNLEAYWGFGSALLGMFTERSVLLSGTPYNNGPQDMATQMTIIDPCHRSANLNWWRIATRTGGKKDVADNIREWKENFMLRRHKSLLAGTLPPKVVGTQQVSPFASELSIYLTYEAQFMTTVQEFAKIASTGRNPGPLVIRRLNELFTSIMAKMTQMRMSLIHPILPGGREITILFSPTRRHLLSKCKEAAKDTCVCCTKFPSQYIAGKKSNEAAEDELDLSSNDMDNGTGDVDLGDDFAVQTGRNRRNVLRAKRANTELGILVPLDSSICHAPDKCKHYIHEKCLKRLEEHTDRITCPRCNDFILRMKVDTVDSPVTPYETYCEHISFGPEVRGIKATAKIQAIVYWIKAIPKEDKAILYSFFKSGLDLLEGILVEHFGMECARFDGDVGTDVRAKELRVFKTSKTCRFLLVSVQSGGVGLNIVEANHVAFLDRWFNPCVHAQAEDRCHRLKQNKKVNVKYFDVNMSVDEVMAAINARKKENATVLLADGTDIGAASENITYKELGGMMGNMMRHVVRCRELCPPFQTLPPCSVEQLLLASEDEPQEGMASRKRIKTALPDKNISETQEESSKNSEPIDLCESGEDEVNVDLKFTMRGFASRRSSAVKVKRMSLEDFDESDDSADEVPTKEVVPESSVHGRCSILDEPKGASPNSVEKRKSQVDVVASSISWKEELSTDELPSSTFQVITKSFLVSEDEPQEGMASRKRIKTTLAEKNISRTQEESSKNSEPIDLCESGEDEVNVDLKFTMRGFASRRSSAVKVKRMSLEDFDESDDSADEVPTKEMIIASSVHGRCSIFDEPKGASPNSVEKRKSQVDVVASSISWKEELSTDELSSSTFLILDKSKHNFRC